MQRLPEIVQGFMGNYPQIVAKCREITPDVILMLQYRPSFHMDEGGYGVYQAASTTNNLTPSLGRLTLTHAPAFTGHRFAPRARGQRGQVESADGFHLQPHNAARQGLLPAMLTPAFGH